MSPRARPRLSAVIPCFNEEPGLPALRSALEALPLMARDDLEPVLIDDGSSDGTWAALSRWARADPRVAALRLAHNGGTQKAIAAGLAAASGEAIAVLDADLQDPPEILEKMLALLERDGAAAVVGLKTERVDDSPIFAALKSAATLAFPLRHGEGDFCVLDREAAKAVVALAGRPAPFRVLRRRALKGRKTLYLPYARRGRSAGNSKFDLPRLAALWWQTFRGFYLPFLEPAGGGPPAVAQRLGRVDGA